MKKIQIKSWSAFIIYVITLTSAFVWSTFKIEAPFDTFAIWLTSGFGFYAGKRLLQKQKKFNNYDED